MDEAAPVEKLKGRLKESCRRFAEETPDFDLNPDAPHPQREAVSMALLAMLDYIRPMVDIGLTKPIVQLLGAIAEIDTGKSNPLLERRRKDERGSPRLGTLEARNRALALAALELAFRSGIKLEEAADDVCRRLPSDITPRKLISWRKKIGKDGRLDEAYRKFINGARGLDPADASDILLTMLDPPTDEESS